MPRGGQEQSVHLWSCSPGFGVFSRKSVHVSTAPAGPRRFNSRQPQSGCESSEMPQQESCRVGVKQAPMHTRCLGRTSEKRSGARGRILKKKKKKIPFNAINIYTKSKEVAEFKLVLYESYSISLTPSSFRVFWIKAPQRRCHSCVNFFFCMVRAVFVKLLYKMLLSKEYKHNN